MDNVTVDDVVRVLELDDFYPLARIVKVPASFQWLMATLYMTCMICSCAASVRTFMAIGIPRFSPAIMQIFNHAQTKKFLNIVFFY